MDLKLVHEDYKFYFNKKVVYNYLKLWYYKDTNTKERKKNFYIGCVGDRTSNFLVVVMSWDITSLKLN